MKDMDRDDTSLGINVCSLETFWKSKIINNYIDFTIDIKKHHSYTNRNEKTTLIDCIYINKLEMPNMLPWQKDYLLYLTRSDSNIESNPLPSRKVLNKLNKGGKKAKKYDIWCLTQGGKWKSECCMQQYSTAPI